MLCVSEPSPIVVGWTDFGHEFEFNPKRVTSQCSAFIEVRPELANRLASPDSATSESRGDHAGADQFRWWPVRRRRQLSIAQHCERRGEVAILALNTIGIARPGTSSPDEIRHPVPQGDGRIRLDLDGLGNLP